MSDFGPSFLSLYLLSTSFGKPLFRHLETLALKRDSNTLKIPFFLFLSLAFGRGAFHRGRNKRFPHRSEWTLLRLWETWRNGGVGRRMEMCDGAGWLRLLNLASIILVLELPADCGKCAWGFETLEQQFQSLDLHVSRNHGARDTSVQPGVSGRVLDASGAIIAYMPQAPSSRACILCRGGC